MPSVHEIYDQTIRPLSRIDREELIGLILEDLALEQPNTVRDRDHLLQLLREGMNSPTHPVTEDTWDYIRAEVRKRHALRQSASQP